jgi:hypothetical protein
VFALSRRPRDRRLTLASTKVADDANFNKRRDRVRSGAYPRTKARAINIDTEPVNDGGLARGKPVTLCFNDDAPGQLAIRTSCGLPASLYTPKALPGRPRHTQRTCGLTSHIVLVNIVEADVQRQPRPAAHLSKA